MGIFPVKYWHLFWRYMRIDSKKLIEYRASFLLLLLAFGLILVINILFWQIIFGMTPTINGWTLGQILVLQGFFWLFVGFQWMFLEGSEHLDDVVLDGELDKYLARPIHALIGHMFAEMNPFGLLAFIMSALHIIAGGYFGAPIVFPHFFGALLILMLGTAVIGLIMMTISFLCFWFGRTAAIWGLWEMMWKVSHYPSVIFPLGVQMIFTLILPIFFLQTYPALLAINAMSFDLFIWILIAELALIGIWFYITRFAWHRALRRYESYGG